MQEFLTRLDRFFSLLAEIFLLFNKDFPSPGTGVTQFLRVLICFASFSSIDLIQFLKNPSFT